MFVLESRFDVGCIHHLKSDAEAIFGENHSAPERLIMPEDIHFNCSHCGQGLVVEAEGAGRSIDCPGCNESLVIPPTSEESTQTIENSTAPPSPPPAPDRLRVPMEVLGKLDFSFSPKIGSFVGQERIRTDIESEFEAAYTAGKTMPHVLLAGSQGMGATYLALIVAGIIAKITGKKIKACSGFAFKKHVDILDVLTGLEDGDVLIIDKIDLVRREFAEYLESALLDFKCTFVLEEAPAPRTIPLNLAHFIVVATTTVQKQLSPMLLVGFGMIQQLSAYTATELNDIAREFAAALELQMDETALDSILRATNGTPKDLMNRMKFLRAFARAKASSSIITGDVAAKALEMFASTNQSNETAEGRVAIPSEVRREVWRRNQGTCVKCGSRENLEFDHIIPVTKGGSNTARNIELLCEVCNRSKSATIQ